MFAAGSMRPEWCFVAQEGEAPPLGRVALWTLPGTGKPLALVLLDVPWEDEGMGAGAQLLGDVLDEARGLGAEKIEHVVDAPPMPSQFQYQPEKRVELLKSAGFALRRQTDRFRLLEEARPIVPGRLSFRTLEEVGEDAFVDAMRMVSEETLDLEIRAERERLGPRGAARDFFDDARAVEHDPSWWRLAYDAGGHLVGLVMPAEPPGSLTLFYGGVVREMRGRGYVDDLLAARTATLLDARAREGTGKPLRADTDVANAPMAAAFRRAGWTRFAGRRGYVADLAPARS